MPSCAGLPSASISRLHGTSGNIPASGGVLSDQAAPIQAAAAVPVLSGVVRQPLRLLNNAAGSRPGFRRPERANPAPAKQVVSPAELWMSTGGCSCMFLSWLAVEKILQRSLSILGMPHMR